MASSSPAGNAVASSSSQLSIQQLNQLSSTWLVPALKTFHAETIQETFLHEFVPDFCKKFWPKWIKKQLKQCQKTGGVPFQELQAGESWTIDEWKVENLEKALLREWDIYISERQPKDHFHQSLRKKFLQMMKLVAKSTPSRSDKEDNSLPLTPSELLSVLSSDIGADFSAPVKRVAPQFTKEDSPPLDITRRMTPIRDIEAQLPEDDDSNTQDTSSDEGEELTENKLALKYQWEDLLFPEPPTSFSDIPQPHFRGHEELYGFLITSLHPTLHISGQYPPNQSVRDPNPVVKNSMSNLFEGCMKVCEQRTFGVAVHLSHNVEISYTSTHGGLPFDLITNGAEAYNFSNDDENGEGNNFQSLIRMIGQSAHKRAVFEGIADSPSRGLVLDFSKGKELMGEGRPDFGWAWLDGWDQDEEVKEVLQSTGWTEAWKKINDAFFRAYVAEEEGDNILSAKGEINYAKALEFYTDAVNHEVKDPSRILLKRSEVELSLRDFDAALQDVQLVLISQPENAKAKDLQRRIKLRIKKEKQRKASVAAATATENPSTAILSDQSASQPLSNPNASPSQLESSSKPNGHTVAAPNSNQAEQSESSKGSITLSTSISSSPSDFDPYLNKRSSSSSTTAPSSMSAILPLAEPEAEKPRAKKWWEELEWGNLEEWEAEREGWVTLENNRKKRQGSGPNKGHQHPQQQHYQHQHQQRQEWVH